MKSPFPGMDPYLEQPAFWSDFHATFINYWREAIAETLPEHYEATIRECVYLVESESDLHRLGIPDAAVTREARLPPTTSLATPGSVPLMLLEGPRECCIEILHRPDRRLVAALELLSPANKTQPGRTEYLAKRRALLQQQVHVVELDLLQGGRRLPFQSPPPRGGLLLFPVAWGGPARLCGVPLGIAATPAHDTCAVDSTGCRPVPGSRQRFQHGLCARPLRPAYPISADTSFVSE